MLRKISCGLLCAGMLFTSANTLAMNHTFTPGVSLEYELPPNDPQLFTNSWFWEITATCTIHTKDGHNDILVEVLKKKGKINGKILTEGDTLLMTVHHNDKLAITAESAGKVKLTNLGSHTVEANCTT